MFFMVGFLINSMEHLVLLHLWNLIYERKLKLNAFYVLIHKFLIFLSDNFGIEYMK